VPRVVRGLRQHDAALRVDARLFAIHQAVEGRELVARDALAGVEHGGEGFTRMFGEARALRK
jgi:hypothetical protein